MHSHPQRSQFKRRLASKQFETTLTPSIFSTMGTSPSPVLPYLKYAIDDSNTTNPCPDNNTASVDCIDDKYTTPRREPRVLTKLTECIENTSAKKSKISRYSRLSRSPGRLSLEKLDKKKYPLASKSPPPSLLSFLHEIDHKADSIAEESTPDEKFNSDSLPRPYAHPTCNDERCYHRTRKCHQVNKIKKVEYDESIWEADNLSAVAIDNTLSGSIERQEPFNSKSATKKKNIRQKDSHRGTTNNVNMPEGYRGRRRLSRKPTERLRNYQSFPMTPEMTKSRLSISDRSATNETMSIINISNSDLESTDSCNLPISQPSSTKDSFSNIVATPPIADSDLESFIEEDLNINQYSSYSATNIWETQKASLPSPGLSPVCSTGEEDFHIDEIISQCPLLKYTKCQESREKNEPDELAISSESRAILRQIPESSIFDIQSVVERFDKMSTDMKTLLMFQLLRRCPRKVLHVVADTVNPALKCDFLGQLPLELSLLVISFLECRDLCRSAQVSKQWRNIIDSNETGWKELFDRDGFVLPPGELEKAIIQGWGWQDPYGSHDFEQDLRVSVHVSSDESALCEKMGENKQAVSTRKRRGIPKRKRTSVGPERSNKRRAVSHEFAEKAEGILAKYPCTAKFHKSEGPLSAANAAILAIPDPKLGLPSLRKLHLFKSLYRRHYMLQKSWMSGKVTPHHFAFPAHSAHVITCLQFDDDKIITGSDDALINVYDTKTGSLRKRLQGHEGGVWALQYEGNVLVSGSTDRSVRVWDIEKGLCTQVFHGHTSTVRCLQILMPQSAGKNVKGEPIMIPTRPLIITGARDSQLRVWRLPEQGSKRYIQTGPPANDADCPYFIRILSGHAHSVRAISAHQDTLVSGSYDNTVRVWKISTGETLQRLIGHTMKVYSVVLDHKRDRCISGSMDNSVKIWSIVTGACLFTLEGHSSLVGLLDLQDERLVSAAADSTMRIWDPENGQCKSTLSAHTGAITCFQHDGQKVISGSDRTLKLWNIKTGECVKDLLIDLGGVWQVKFDKRRCVAAVQRNNMTYVEVLDFGASRDGVPAYQCGSRRLLTDISDHIIVIDDNEDI